MSIPDLTARDIENIMDALREWDDHVGPKELEEQECGLNHDRFLEIKMKLEDLYWRIKNEC